MAEHLKVTEKLINKLKNNVEETIVSIEKEELTDAFWIRMSEEEDLSEMYIEKFQDMLHWNSIFLNNKFLTSEFMERYYLPLLRGKRLWTCDPYKIILLNKNLSLETLEWLIINAPMDNIYMIWMHMEAIGKEKFFWNSIFRNPNLTTEFRSDYNYLNPPQNYEIGDKVHVSGLVNKGIIGAINTEGDVPRYLIIDTAHVYSDRSRVVYARYSEIRRSWVR